MPPASDARAPGPVVSSDNRIAVMCHESPRCLTFLPSEIDFLAILCWCVCAGDGVGGVGAGAQTDLTADGTGREPRREGWGEAV